MIETPRAARSLVLVDGLPGSGKSTTAHLLALHLARHGQPARWYWELESPHPVFEFQEALDGDRLRDAFVETAFHNWTALASDLRTRTECVILESSFLQSAIHPMLLLDWSEDRIADYVLSVARIIAPANPLLALLRVDDVATMLRGLAEQRGEDYVGLLDARISASPYGRARGLRGMDGVIRYAEGYRDLLDALCRRLEMETLVLETDNPGVSFVDRIGRALGLPPFVPFATDVDPGRFAGRYTRVGTEDACQIVTDGTQLYVDGVPPMPLIHRGGHTFDAAGTCVQFEFRASGGGAIDAIACRGNFPHLAPDWMKSA